MGDPKNAFITLMVFLFALDLFAGALVATGIADTVGLSIQPSETGTTEEIQQNFRDDQDTGAATGETLFSLYNQVTSTLGELGKTIQPSLGILNNAGTPDWIINQFLTPIITVIKGIGILYVLRGI